MTKLAKCAVFHDRKFSVIFLKVLSFFSCQNSMYVLETSFGR